MKCYLISKRALVIAVVLLGLALPALGQLQSGNIHGTVASTDGATLPGVTITLTAKAGSAGTQTTVTDANGGFRFLGLSPGTYQVKAEVQGYSPVESQDLPVNVGRNTQIELTMTTQVSDIITIVEETPLLDPRRPGQTQTVTLADLERIPSARDPWAVLQTAPGVLTDRINVGGNESGQQSQYVGPGSSGGQAIWSLDGVVITDMSAVGSSPAYYDFDAFEEMQVTTGGSDASMATGGVVLNMVTKRGTNEWRGSARYYKTDDSTQSDLSFDRGELGQAGEWNNDTAQEEFKQGNRIVENTDWGAEIGGPIVRDRLWVWGAYSDQDIQLLTINDFSDATVLENWNVKLNAQITPSNSATAFAFHSDKIKNGRNAGPLRPQETTWNQSGFGDNPTTWKLEDTQLFGSSFFVTGMYSVVNGGFQLVPQGGDAVPFLDREVRWHNSFLLNQVERPQEQLKADAATFFSTGTLSHELKFGAGHRSVEQSSLFHWPGGGVEIAAPVDSNPDNDLYLLFLARDATPRIETEYTTAYVQDTFARGNLTVNAGLRYDRQGGENLSSRAAANPLVADLLPEVSYEGGDIGFQWESVTPRLGLTYALGAEGKTLLRASYSRFADQLATGLAGWLNPLGGIGYAVFLSDNRGGPSVEPGEIGPFLGYAGSINPETGGTLQNFALDPNLEAPITDEVLLGIERSLRPDFVVGLNLNYRRYTGVLDGELLVFDGEGSLDDVGRPHRREDYVQAAPVTVTAPDGRQYTVQYWELKPGITTRDGLYLENGDREQEFKGASLVFNKRLANRWMMRGNVSWQDWTWNVPDSENEDPTDLAGGGVVDGTDVLQNSGTTAGPKANVFISSEWSYSLTGMYQIVPDRPWGFNVAASLNGRQGYPLRYVARIGRETITDGAGVGLDIPIAADAGAYRYDDVHVLDLRAEKEFTLSGFGLTLGVDVFNALNESNVLQRQGVLGLDNSDHVLEILSPRVYRVGARVSFR
ncbi:MAG TPA: carboxypeptidase regulatory-like domain-containing protein [Thermoanaerobaculia bacterium]